MEEEVEGTQEVLPARGSGLLCPPRCPPLPILNATFPSVADPCLLPAQPVAKSPTALFILPTSPALPRSSLHDPVPISLPPRCPGRSLLCSEGACPAVLPRGVGRAGPHSADFPDPPPRRAWLSLAPLAPAGAPGVGVKAGHSWRRPREERARAEQPRTQRFALPGLEAAGRRRRLRPRSAADKSSGLKSSGESEGRGGGEQHADLTEKQSWGWGGGRAMAGKQTGGARPFPQISAGRPWGSLAQRRYLTEVTSEGEEFARRVRP